ncbi:hypothetical protein MHU86_8313 [Fragilaria crotonensis]|nr:hypothetical protein MHU86_8313 [Fragilaria crotonensis]
MIKPLVALESIQGVQWIPVIRERRWRYDSRLIRHGHGSGFTRQLPIRYTQLRSADGTYLRKTKLENCVGITEQYTINEDGDRVPKLRLTHDQSFNSTQGAKRSVNDRVEASQLTPARFGRAMTRLLHSVCFFEATAPTRKAATHEGGLQVRLSADPPAANHGG